MSKQEQIENMKVANELGLDPMMEKSAGQVMKDIPKRVLVMVSKMVQKEFLMRLIAFSIATHLMMTVDRFSDWAWVVLAGMLIFGEKFLEVMKNLRR